MSTALDPDPGLARRRVGAGAALLLLLVALGIAVLVTALSPRGGSATLVEAVPTPDLDEAGASGSIYVHLLGRVRRPGLYELPEGSRVVDAVAAGGGFAEGADPGAVNLARLLVDGEQLYLPAEGEAPPGAVGDPTAGGAGGRVNLNTADAAALDTLPRIGPALAARIVAWREANGRFTAVEDLLAVSGIGERTLDGLRDLVTV